MTETIKEYFRRFDKYIILYAAPSLSPSTPPSPWRSITGTKPPFSSSTTIGTPSSARTNSTAVSGTSTTVHPHLRRLLLECHSADSLQSPMAQGKNL